MSEYQYRSNQGQGQGNPTQLRRLIIAGVVVFILIIVLFKSAVTVTAGQAGVLYKRFGGGVDTTQTYGEGFHIIAPWNKLYIYEVRQKEVLETMKVLSSNGLDIELEASAWYKPEYGKLAVLHQTVGESYLERIVQPTMRSAARSVIGRYTPEQIYSSKRDAIQEEIFEETKIVLSQKNIILDRVLVRDVTLPATIKTAIERKLKQEQEALEYEFRLQKAAKEAERIRIEAQGKADANKILNASLTPNILKEKGIEATLKLAKSNNSKVIVVGSGKDGLPLILGNN